MEFGLNTLKPTEITKPEVRKWGFGVVSEGHRDDNAARPLPFLLGFK